MYFFTGITVIAPLKKLTLTISQDNGKFRTSNKIFKSEICLSLFKRLDGRKGKYEIKN